MTHVDEILQQRNTAEQLAVVESQLEKANAALERAKGKRLVLAKATTTTISVEDIPFYNKGKNYLLGYVNPDKNKRRTYHETLPLVRWFYENDPVAGTVVNR